ncbi:MAG TPA: hypothetical protein VLA09_12725 [Longimicrobiales bacterium]|nr:hypothetical protein [Longimicrobiales bacterium]
MGRRSKKPSKALSVAGLWCFLLANPVAGQEVARVAVSVDYVGVEGVYLGVGTAQGAQVGDTVQVFATPSDARPLGALLFLSSARNRSVATVIESAFAVARGDSLFLDLPVIEVPAEAEQRAVAAPLDAAASRGEAARARGAPRVSGRVSLDLQARETRTSWRGEDLFGTTSRRYATPVSNLTLRVAELPGGFSIETNLRGAYRYSDGVPIAPARSLRVYNLSVVKTFDSTPLELRLGRFHNPYEPYSAYWDGALMRVGGRSGPGIGVVTGFDPDRSDEGFSRDVAKITGFADFRAGSGAWRYDTDLSLHYLQSRLDGLSDRTFAGWSQRLSVGRTTITQRLRVDRDPVSGRWELAQLRVRTGIALRGPLRLNLAYARLRPELLRETLQALSPVPEREEVTAGLSLFQRGTSLVVDAGSTRWSDQERGLSLSASASTRVSGVLLLASGRRWSRRGMSSLAAAPGFGFRWRRLTARIGYQFYRTRTTQTLVSHSGNIELTASPTRSMWLTLGGEKQWGANFRGTGVRLTLGHSF